MSVGIHRWLLPASWLYGAAVGLRNRLYDRGLLKVRHFDIPIISVGNITVGGTGKTPHVEYLIRLLGPQYNVAVLSRGYKRKSRGYVLASPETPMQLIGDEPWQMKQKFGQRIQVAVDANRSRGIRRLTHDEATREVQVILLDDAFQHRAVSPGLNIVLTNYHRPVDEDALLPAGRLREPAGGLRRADIVVVSKCPEDITPTECRAMRERLRLRPGQELYFSTLRYGMLRQIFGKGTRRVQDLREECVHVLLVTGIGSPQQMEQDMRRYTEYLTCLAFPDHHYFTGDDVARIQQTLASLPRPHIIVTTEKDAARMTGLQGLNAETREQLYVLPVEVEILRSESNKFNLKIEAYVRQNS